MTNLLVPALVLVAAVIVVIAIKNRKSNGSNPIPKNHGGTGSSNNLQDEPVDNNPELLSVDGTPVKPEKDPTPIDDIDIDSSNPKPELGEEPQDQIDPKPLPIKPVKKPKKNHPGKRK